MNQSMIGDRTEPSGAMWSPQTSPLGEGYLGTFLEKITKLQDCKTLSKGQYEWLVLLACSVYVEREVARQIEDTLQEVLSRTLGEISTPLAFEDPNR